MIELVEKAAFGAIVIIVLGLWAGLTLSDYEQGVAAYPHIQEP